MNFNSVESQSASYEFNFGKTFGKFGKTFKSTNLLPLRLLRTFRECFAGILETFFVENFFFWEFWGFCVTFIGLCWDSLGYSWKYFMRHRNTFIEPSLSLSSSYQIGGLINILVRQFFIEISLNSDENWCKMSVVQKNLHDSVPLWSKRTVVYAATMTSIGSWI